jgi:hypothetical protein
MARVKVVVRVKAEGTTAVETVTTTGRTAERITITTTVTRTKRDDETKGF